MLPEIHRAFIDYALPRLAQDRRLVGVAAAGSYADGAMDEFSDLDLVIAVEPDRHAEVMLERRRIAESLGSLLAAFTGEHVNEPRLLICLYGPALLHVDLKFVALPDAAHRVDDPIVLWEREGRLSEALSSRMAEYPQPNAQWIEDRFWIWVHYATTKIGRGELFESIEFLSSLRLHVLGPLGLVHAELRPAGVRKIELLAPALAEALRSTVAGYDRDACFAALRACIALYRQLRQASNLQIHAATESATVAYLDEIEARFDRTHSPWGDAR